ncbi:proteolipid protein DM beta isoform X1 [Patella vulgata]|uniref:proteolipid protein DM beta isoform X1 n=1 Tax=Patella vulgata TaxID=6465 RepID=UPI0021802664|nr:proteolipid protein DM beta isoform X1 [Patella vulgata]
MPIKTYLFNTATNGEQCEGCYECIGKTPFASLIAGLICIIGVGVFCGSLYRALSLIIEGVLNSQFLFNVGWLEVIQVVFIIIAVCMAVLAIILMVFGYLATGATRENLYSGTKCIMGGRVSACFFMVVSYILGMAWIVILSVMVVPIIVYASISQICDMEVYRKTATSFHYCFNLTQFGIYRNESYPAGTAIPGKEALCEHYEVKPMCDKVLEAGPLFSVAYGGAFCIVLGMILFMICLAANYTRIKISKELTQYRDAVEMEELDIHSLTDKKTPISF